VLVRFVCPECGKRVGVEEIVTDVTLTSRVNTLARCPDGGVDADYGAPEAAGGDLDRYQCAHCGFTVAQSREALLDWLVEHKQLAPEIGLYCLTRRQLEELLTEISVRSSSSTKPMQSSVRPCGPT
jgi:hypothetical protein